MCNRYVRRMQFSNFGSPKNLDPIKTSKMDALDSDRERSVMVTEESLLGSRPAPTQLEMNQLAQNTRGGGRIKIHGELSDWSRVY